MWRRRVHRGIVASLTDRASLSNRAHLGDPISACNEDTTHQHRAAANVGVVWAGRRVHRGGWPRSGSGAPSVCRSHHRAPLAGWLQSSVAPALVRGRRRFWHRGRFDRWAGSHRHRGRPSVAAAPLFGLFDTFGHARTVCRARGSFAGPYNTRLHQTAPCAFSDSARGERV